MQKLGIIRHDTTPSTVDDGELVFDCDNSKTGEEVLIKKAQEDISKESSKTQEKQ